MIRDISLLITAAASTTVSPYRTVTDPLACLASVPVSMTSSRPPSWRDHFFSCIRFCPAGKLTNTRLSPVAALVYLLTLPAE